MGNSLLSMEYWPLWLVFIGGALLIVIACLALLLTREKQEMPENMRPPKRSLGQMLTELMLRDYPQEPVERKQLLFVRMGQYSYRLPLSIQNGQWMVIGGGADADFQLSRGRERDRRLQNRHFRICFEADGIWICAAEGETFVNGVPIGRLGTVPLHSGDRVQAGSYEYRVVWEA